jgi:hypothetical protein
MTRMGRRGFLLGLGAAMAIACGGSTEPKATSVAGTWTGQTGSQVMTLVLTQSGASIGGTASLTNTPTGTRSFTVVGTRAEGELLNVTLTSGISSVNMSAAVNPNGREMIGTLSGGGFGGELITLRR